MSGNRGVTLLEVLISLIVFALAIVGILSLITPALHGSNKSIEDTMSSALASSIHNALCLAMRTPVYESQAQKYRATFVGDIRYGSSGAQYTFRLPRITEGWRHFPSGAGGSISTPDNGIALPANYPNSTNLPIFLTGGDSQVYSYAKAVTDWGGDKTDPYLQFGFFFAVRKKDLHPETTDNNIKERSQVYEFNLYVVRTFPAGGGSGGGSTPAGGGLEFVVLNRYSFELAVK